MNRKRSTEELESVARRRPPDEILRSILDAGADDAVEARSLHVGRLLEALAGERGVRRVLEVGTALGLHTVCLARGAAQAEIVSLDGDDRHFASVAEVLERAGVAARVRLESGDPFEVVGRLEGRFDLIHLAMAPVTSRRLVDRLLPRLEVGGLLTVERLAPRPVGGESAEETRSVASYLVLHPQLDCCVLPVGEGLAVARKKRPTVTELGGPF